MTVHSSAALAAGTRRGRAATTAAGWLDREGVVGYLLMTPALLMLVVFIAYLAQLYAPINQITQSWGLIAGARVGATRVFEVMETEADLKSGTRQFPPEGARGDIAWRGVSFRYRPETPVLAGIELKIPAGARIAIVGSISRRLRSSRTIRNISQTFFRDSKWSRLSPRMWTSFTILQL